MAKETPMYIEQIYVYPIKSFRGVSLPSATLTKHGFPYDRSFMVLQIVDDKETGGKKYKNMSVADYNEMVRFFPSINDAEATMTVTFKPTDGGAEKTIEIPLEPDVSDLEEVDVLMHLSPTKAYKMPDEYNDWLSSCFGYDCILTYISSNLREVRFLTTEKHKETSPPASAPTSTQPTGLFSSLTSLTSKVSDLIIGTDTPEETKGIRFSDVAPYLIVSSKSMDDVHPRLPASEVDTFDITKFRPNVIVAGAREPWEEDFWGELTIAGRTRLEAEHNCGRCRSINIDYATGAQGKGEAGKMLKMLMRDRRVDAGTKWSPIFGRYAFLPAECEGDVIKVGEEVVVSRVNKDRTAFDWKGLSTLPGGGRE